jgi:hypothetical protein
MCVRATSASTYGWAGIGTPLSWWEEEPFSTSLDGGAETISGNGNYTANSSISDNTPSSYTYNTYKITYTVFIETDEWGNDIVKVESTFEPITIEGELFYHKNINFNSPHVIVNKN